MINNELISDFKMKANHFNSFFASYCTPLNNNIKLPGSQTYITESKLSSLQFEDKDIKIIKSLNINKAHGHDDILIRILKICDLPIIKSLSIIFRNCINNSTFPDLCKKSNICPIHKKGDKQIRLIFNSLCEYLEKCKLSAHQSSFQVNNSCVDHLLSIIHNIYTAFDECPILESCGVFLDMSKAFNKVWHEGLTFKLK